MTGSISIALAQINPIVGDVIGNANKVRSARDRAAELGANLVVTSELVIPGYPPEDLVLRPSFQESAKQQVELLASETADGGPAVLLGSIWQEKGSLYNAAILLDEGEIKSIRYKHDLPNYGVFDEKRIFDPGPLPGPINFRGVRLGVMICEDMWGTEVTECLQESGAQLLIVLNGSPYSLEKWDQRLSFASARVGESGLPLLYVNQVGGQDELVFDGGSFVLGSDRILKVRCSDWLEDLRISCWELRSGEWSCSPGEVAQQEDNEASVYSAMMLGLRDYVLKSNFHKVVIGLSGGIDSALVAVMAVDALGADNVVCLALPSKFNSSASLDDAKQLSENLGITLETIGIQEIIDKVDQRLAPLFQGKKRDVTEENIQSRLRAVLLMAFSNKEKHLLLSTGNKSEIAVGYSTIYGDMAGAYNPLKDIYKTKVYKLSKWRNIVAKSDEFRVEKPIPDNILLKEPSAELAFDQKDTDSLPSYDELDTILEYLIEDDLAVQEVVKKGFLEKTVVNVKNLLYLSEYKRYQACPGPKISRRPFSLGRRIPIVNHWRD